MSSEKILYCNGCSFVNGVELFTEGMAISSEASKFINETDYVLALNGLHEEAEFNRNHRFTRLVANELGYKEVNNSTSGSDNQWITERSIEDITKILDHGTKPEDLFIIIGWSGITRLPVIDRGKRVGGIPFSNYRYEKPTARLVMLTELEYSQHAVSSTAMYLRTVHHLRTFLESKNISYLFLDTVDEPKYFDTIFKYSNGSLVQVFDTYYSNKNFLYEDELNPRNIDEWLDGMRSHSFASFTSSNNYPLCDHHHPGIKANREFATLVTNKIRSKL